MYHPLLSADVQVVRLVAQILFDQDCSAQIAKNSRRHFRDIRLGYEPGWQVEQVDENLVPITESYLITNVPR